MIRNPIIRSAAAAYQFFIIAASSLQSVFLLAIRLYWGWQFHTTGAGKLGNIPKITDYFQSLGIPFPHLSAYLAGTTECVGGLFLLLGLASRLTAIPLIFTMIVAYCTAESDVVKHIFSDPDKFVSADPFLFMLAAIIVLLFGPGLFSIDGAISWRMHRKQVDQQRPAPSVAT